MSTSNAIGVRAAIYARVSCDQQAQCGTIASQVEALEQRVATDGLFLDAELRFIDDGYTGSTLSRPALERLRDQAAAGAVDRLYVHSPDRLARRYAYQVLLVDELQQCGVELVFLNRALSQGPEDELLLQVQGVVAEYEQAKIMERSRRGKLHAARARARSDRPPWVRAWSRQMIRLMRKSLCRELLVSPKTSAYRSRSCLTVNRSRAESSRPTFICCMSLCSIALRSPFR